MIADHDISEAPVLVIGCQAVEAIDEFKLFSSLPDAVFASWTLLSQRWCSFVPGRTHPSSLWFEHTFLYQILVDVRTSSASSPKQYSNVLICSSLLLPVIPDAMQNCSKCFLHFGHSSGLLTLNFAVEHWPFLLFRWILIQTDCGIVASASGLVTWKFSRIIYSRQVNTYTLLVQAYKYCVMQ